MPDTRPHSRPPASALRARSLLPARFAAAALAALLLTACESGPPASRDAFAYSITDLFSNLSRSYGGAGPRDTPDGGIDFNSPR